MIDETRFLSRSHTVSMFPWMDEEVRQRAKEEGVSVAKWIRDTIERELMKVKEGE